MLITQLTVMTHSRGVELSTAKGESVCNVQGRRSCGPQDSTVTGCEARDNDNGTARCTDGGGRNGALWRTADRGQRTENRGGRRLEGRQWSSWAKAAWRRKGKKENSPGKRRPYIQLVASQTTHPPDSSPRPNLATASSPFCRTQENTSDFPPH